MRPRRRTSRGFTITVIVSLALHVLAVGGALYAQSRNPPPLDLSKAIPVQLVKLGKKRDPNLLPRITAPPPPASSEGVALEKKDTPPQKKTEKRERTPELSDAAKRMLERSPADLDRALNKIEEEEGDPDGDEFGTTTDATNAAAGYQAEIVRTLKRAYSLPEAIPASQRQFLEARVVLFIERSGRIENFEFVARHPNPLFMSALETLLRSIVLPPPPAAEAKRFAESGVEVIFRP